jgi:hypothetical protein
LDYLIFFFWPKQKKNVFAHNARKRDNPVIIATTAITLIYEQDYDFRVWVSSRFSLFDDLGWGTVFSCCSAKG